MTGCRNEWLSQNQTKLKHDLVSRLRPTYSTVRMARIYRPDPASLMDKTKLIKPTAVKIENVPRPIFVSQVLHVDLMSCSSKVILSSSQ